MSVAIFWGAVLRVSQAFVQAAPTILVGLFVAGIFRRLLGHEGTRRLFGCGTRRELPQAWLVGMLSPVCSLGVIPIAREMRRARISGGAILAFAMTAPLFNPLSMLYGLTLSAPFVILSFALCTMVVVTAVGAIWNRIHPATAHEEPAPPPVAVGAKRMVAILVVAAREVVGPSLGYIAIALTGVALLAVILPPGSLQSTMEHKNPYAPLAMTGVAIPAYATPLVAMSQLGSMFQHANSVGAAFVLLTLGAGINLGLQGHAMHFIPIWDDWTRRLQVGVFLREGSLTPYRRMKAKVFRDRLEFLKHAVEEGDKEETHEYVGTADRAYRRMRHAYLGSS